MDGVHKIKYAFGNGMRQDIWAEFQTRFMIPHMLELYGATESPIAFINLTNKFGSCGRSSPYLVRALMVSTFLTLTYFIKILFCKAKAEAIPNLFYLM